MILMFNEVFSGNEKITYLLGVGISTKTPSCFRK